MSVGITVRVWQGRSSAHRSPEKTHIVDFFFLFVCFHFFFFHPLGAVDQLPNKYTESYLSYEWLVLAWLVLASIP